MAADWSPVPTDPARRLVQVRRVIRTMYLTEDDRVKLEELAEDLEKELNLNITKEK